MLTTEKSGTNMGCVGKSICVVGLAAVSVWAHIATGGVAGTGWAILAVLVLFFGSCGENSK